MVYSCGVSTTDQTPPPDTGKAARDRRRYDRVREQRAETAPPSILASTATDTIAAWIGEHHQAGDLIYPYGVYTQQRHPQAIPALVTKTMRGWADRGWLEEAGDERVGVLGHASRRYYEITDLGHTHFVAAAVKLRYLARQLDPAEDA
jgi:hypothetical protein